MHIVKEWTTDDGTQVRLALALRGGFGSTGWSCLVKIKPKRKRNWVDEPDWRKVISRDGLLAIQRELCDQLCAMEPR